jgi:hypothetical protein
MSRRSRVRGLVAVAAGMIAASGARAVRAAEEPAAAALRSDLERIVEIQQAGGWRIDRYEIEEMMPSALMTVCKVPRATRASVLAGYDRAIALRGGPIDEAWAKTRSFAAIEPLLFLSRVRALLAEANVRAETECPVWVEPDPGFLGYQSDLGRFTANVETGGLLQIRRSEGRWTYGGGGVIRVLLGRGFDRLSILAGGEFAGGAMLRGGGGDFVINYFPALPVVVRFHDRTWHYDLEVAPVALFQADDGRFSWGARIGVGGGIQAKRTRGLLPWAGIAFAYETYASGARPSMQFLRGGLRVGIVWN